MIPLTVTVLIVYIRADHYSFAPGRCTLIAPASFVANCNDERLTFE